MTRNNDLVLDDTRAGPDTLTVHLTDEQGVWEVREDGTPEARGGIEMVGIKGMPQYDGVLADALPITEEEAKKLADADRDKHGEIRTEHDEKMERAAAFQERLDAREEAFQADHGDIPRP